MDARGRQARLASPSRLPKKRRRYVCTRRGYAIRLAKLARLGEPRGIKIAGIILLVLGLAGLGGGAYGITEEKKARDTIADRQKLLRDTAPTLETELGLDLNDIKDLVALDRAIKDDIMLLDNVRNAV